MFASVERPPVLGGKVKSYDDKDALRVRGVHQTVAIPPFYSAVRNAGAGWSRGDCG